MQTLLTLLILILASTANCAVWTAKAAWSDAEERHYQEWIAQKLRSDFFVTGPWAGIKTDCADAVYAARIIFSFENSLPFATRSSLKTKQGPMSLNNDATLWDHIQSPEARVRAFVDAVNDVTWTGSLTRDTEAVEISKEAIVPGVMWLRPGHVELVKNVRSSGVIDLIGSTVPAAVRSLMTVTDLGYIPDRSGYGFRKWRQQGTEPKAPINTRQTTIVEKREDLDFLSSAQRAFQFEASMRTTLASRTELQTETVGRVANDFCTLLHSRAEIVGLSEVRRSKLQHCMNDRDYDAYSTPSRDLRIRRTALHLGLLMKNNLNAVETALQQCSVIVLGDGVELMPFEFLKRLLKFEYSSDPNENMLTRFGFTPALGSCGETGRPTERSAPQSGAN